MAVPESQIRRTESDLGELFHVNFFPPLVCTKLPDKSVVRLSSCSRSLNRSLSQEVRAIHERLLPDHDATGWLCADSGMDSLQFLLCLSYALVKSLARGNMAPVERYMASMAFGSHGCHANSVGYCSIREIFDTDDDDEEAPWFY